MKKSSFLLIAAAAMLTVSCSNDVVDNELNRDVISVRATLSKMSKGVLVDGSNLGQFSLYASHCDTAVIPQCNARVDGQGLTSGYGYHYWPQDNGAVQVKFYAWGPNDAKNGGQITATDNVTFTVQPNDDVDTQVDFVFANTQKDLNTGKNGVNLYFRHALSQIVVKVRNSQPNYKFNVRGWKMVYLDKNGKFTYGGSSTDEITTLNKSYWSENTDAALANYYAKTLASPVTITVADTVMLGGNMLLVPQDVNKATGYTSPVAGSPLNGSYLAILMNIVEASTDNELKAEQWCCWPVDFAWNPGYKYIYTVDLGGGGYIETTTGGTDPQPVIDMISIIPVLPDWIEYPIDAVLP